MRVVGGTYRGRRLAAPPGDTTRPTAGRVREALFSVLSNAVPGARVLDIYAGSGSLGIEALSRGASRVVFVEQARAAADTIRANLAGLKLPDPSVAVVLQRSIERCISALLSSGPFELCLVDPPFSAVRDGSAMRTVGALVRAGVIAQDGLMVFEYPSDQACPQVDLLEVEAVRAYGDTRLVFLRHSVNVQEPENLLGN